MEQFLSYRTELCVNGTKVYEYLSHTKRSFLHKMKEIVKNRPYGFVRMKVTVTNPFGDVVDRISYVL